MRSVRGILKSKGDSVWSVGPDDSVFEALRIMADKGVGALLVLQAGRVVGIFSERDYARKGILEGRASKDTPVRDIMTERVVYVSPGQTLEECLALMTDKRIRHLPVMEEDELLGVVSIGDLVKGIIDHQKFLIQQLEHYVSH
ncbi:MAG: CBS domain-containing protein [Gemmatimonadetes bacterium]|nr:CBS domain-containing protein [Gemmatimonadota bacterium]NNM31909.1 CBS domain-containing protein [Gemmatimonadota bacterium]